MAPLQVSAANPSHVGAHVPTPYDFALAGMRGATLGHMSLPRSTPQPAPHHRLGRETQDIRSFLDPNGASRALAELAGAQHGVLTLAQIVAVTGLTPAGVRSRARSGRLHRVHRAVYSVVPLGLLAPSGHHLAAVLACARPVAALSHQSAAKNLGIRVYNGRKVHVTVASRAGRSQPGIDIHRSATLTPTDIQIVNGIPTTRPARTLRDLASRLSPEDLRRAIDRAFDAELLTADDLERNRTKRLSAALALRAETLDMNDLERRFLRIVRSAGLPAPETQVYVDLGDGEPMIRPDFLWRDRNLIIETDGWGTHGKRTRFEADRRRDQRAAAHGFQTIRVSRNQVRDESLRLRELLVALEGLSK